MKNDMFYLAGEAIAEKLYDGTIRVSEYVHLMRSLYKDDLKSINSHTLKWELKNK